MSTEERLRSLIATLAKPEGEKMGVLFQIWKTHRALPTRKPLSDYLDPEVVVRLVRTEGERHCAIVMDEMLGEQSLQSFDDYVHWLRRTLCQDENAAWAYVHDDVGDEAVAARYETLAADGMDYLAGLEYDIRFDEMVADAREDVLSEVAHAAMNEYLNVDHAGGYYALKECLEQMDQAGMLAQREIADDGRDFLAIYEESRQRRAAHVLAAINARSLPGDERRNKINEMLDYLDVTEMDVVEFAAKLATVPAAAAD